jgi:hypothetical protein
MSIYDKAKKARPKLKRRSLENSFELAINTQKWAEPTKWVLIDKILTLTRVRASAGRQNM